MTAPVVHPTDSTQGNYSWSTADFAVTMPGNIASGDLLLIFIAFENNSGSNKLTAPSGWTSIAQGDWNVEAACFARRADGNEGASVNISRAALGGAVAWSCHRVTGDYGGAIGSDCVVTALTGFDEATVLDPPNVNFPAGWGATDALVFAVGCKHNGRVTNLVYPSGYSNGGYSVVNGDSGPVAWCSKAVTATTFEDPPSGFDLDPLYPGVTFTVAIRGNSTGNVIPEDQTNSAIAANGLMTLTGDVVSVKSYWRVPTNAPDGTDAHLTIFTMSSTDIVSVFLQSGVAANGGYFTMDVIGDVTPDGEKRYALISNWNGVLGTTSIFGGPCIATKVIEVL